MPTQEFNELITARRTLNRVSGIEIPDGASITALHIGADNQEALVVETPRELTVSQLRKIHKDRLVAVVLLFAACAYPSPSTEAPPPTVAFSVEQAEQAGMLWANSIGIAQLDPDVWRTRLEEMCELGVWEKAVAADLAGKYVEADAHLSSRAPGVGAVDIGDATNALWGAGIQVCAERYPAGYEVDGPPFPEG